MPQSNPTHSEKKALNESLTSGHRHCMPAASHPHKSCAVDTPQQPSSCTTRNHWLLKSGFLPSPSAVSSAKPSPEPKPSKRFWQCGSGTGRKNQACRSAEEESSAVEQHNLFSAFATGTSPQATASFSHRQTAL